MNFKLTIILSMMLWMSSHGQVPEHLYYKFNDSSTIFNYASNPQGSQNIPVPNNLFIDTIGFLNSNSLSGSANPAAGGVNTNYQPDYSKSFTISFWYKNDISNPSQKCYYLFGDSVAGFHCLASIGGGVGFVSLHGQGGFSSPNLTLLPQPALGTMIHIVYDATPMASVGPFGPGPYGTYTIYANGFSLLGTVPVTTPPLNQSSGLSIGSAPVSLNTINPPCADITEDIAGNIDEFRWYNRALTPTEILNTLSVDLTAIGNCPGYTNFSIDSISGEAAKVSWSPGNGNDGFFLEYGTAGFNRGSGTTITGNYPGSQPPVYLTGLSPETEYDIYFGENCSSGTDSIHNPKPQTFKTTPSCPTPIHIEVTALGTDSARINWAHYGPVQEYYITYGTSGFDTLTSGKTDTVSSLPHDVGGLASGSFYDFYISTSCGGTNGNSITVKRTIATECSIKTAPYFEGFEDSTWVPVNFSTQDAINVCWSRMEGGYYNWQTYDGSLINRGTTSGNNGSLKYLGSPGNYIYEGQTSEIYSPMIDISGITTPYLSFYYHRHHVQNFIGDFPQPDFWLEINDGNGWVKALVLERGDQLNQNDPYKKAGVDLSVFGDTIQMRFVSKGIYRGLHSVMSIDDVSIDEAPVCPDIFNVSSHIFGADTSVILDIDSYSNSWQLNWGPSGFSQGSGCASVLSAPFTIDSCITVNNSIDVYIKECQAMSWNGPFEVCGLYSAPYITNFSDNDPLAKKAECWDIYSSGKESSGDLVSIKNDNSSYSGINSLRLFNQLPENNDTLMAISPAFVDLPLGNRQIRFMGIMAAGNSQGVNSLVIGTIADPHNGYTFSPVDTINLSLQWKEYVVNFDVGSGSPYNGMDNRIVLKAGNGIDQIFIDDFHYEEIPSCPAPLRGTLLVVDEWYDAATVSWSGYSVAYSEVSWGSPGFNPAINALGNAITTNTSYRIPSLTPNTTYEFYVRDSCGVNDLSDWVGPYRFTTLCSPFSAPFSENFDGNSWISAPLLVPGPFGPMNNRLNIEDTLDACWKRNIEPGTLTNSKLSIDYYHTWGLIPKSLHETFGVVESGPLQDHSGSGNYVFPIPYARKSIGDNIPDTADLYLPLVDISPLNRPYLSYYYHRFTMENYMPDVLVQVSNGAGWSTIDSLTGITQMAASDPFFQRGIPLSGLGDTIRLRFRSLYVGALDLQGQIGNSERGISAIDEIEIKEAPPCTTPLTMNVYHQIDTAQNKWNTYLTWENLNTSINEYQVLISSPGANPDSLALLGNLYSLTSDSLVLDTLHPGCYEFFVRTICGSGDTSDFSNPRRFCVPCLPIKAPLREIFDLTDPLSPGIPLCWERKYEGNNPNLSYNWLLDTASILAFTGPAGDYYGLGQYAYIETQGAIGDTAELYSPLVDISGLSKPEVYFAYHMFGVDIGTLHMDVFDGFNWYKDIWALTGQQQLAQVDPWLDTIIKLDPYNSTGLIQVRFWSVKTGNFGRAAIDNFRISDTLTCPFPTRFRMIQNTDSSATLSWDSGPNSTDFTVEYGPRGFTYGAGTKIVSSTNRIIIPAADNRLYSAYLKSNCGAGDSSFVVGPVYFQSRVVPCDDFEVYQLGPVKDQSSLIKPWDPAPNSLFNHQGDQVFSNASAQSGTKSLHMLQDTSNGVGGSGVLAHFDEIASGLYAIDFSFNIADAGGGFYEFISYVSPTGVAQGLGGGVDFYLNQTNSSLDLMDLQGALVARTPPFITGWNDLRHIIDFARDTAWIILNGVNVRTGWKYIDPNEPYLRLHGVHFLTTPSNINFSGQGSNFFVDDFCVEPYQCPSPSGLTLDNLSCTQAAFSWNEGQNGSIILVEYGSPGFTQGSGIFRSKQQTADTLTGLLPGTSYEIYVAELCGYDTIYTGPVSFTTLTNATADFTFITGNPGSQGVTVDFDGTPSVGANSYSWLFNNSATATGATPSYTFTSNGTFPVQLVITSDCGNDTITKSVQISGIGLAENILNSSLVITPNPFKDKVNIRFETQSSGAVIHLSDLSGRLILQKKLNHTNGKYQDEINLQHLASGTYLIRVKSGPISAIRKLVKK